MTYYFTCLNCSKIFIREVNLNLWLTNTPLRPQDFVDWSLHNFNQCECGGTVVAQYISIGKIILCAWIKLAVLDMDIFVQYGVVFGNKVLCAWVKNALVKNAWVKNTIFFCDECENEYIQISDLDKDYIIRWVPNRPIDSFPRYRCECGGYLFYLRPIKRKRAYMTKVLCAWVKNIISFVVNAKTNIYKCLIWKKII